MAAPALVPDDIAAWVESLTGGRIVATERPATGGSRALSFIEVDRNGERVPLVLRLEEGGGFSGTEISVAREAAVYAALADTDVPVPRVVGVAPEGAAVLLERVSGTGELRALDDDTRRVTLEHFVDALATLHNVDVASLDLDGLPRPTTPEEHARLDLAMWRRIAREHVPNLDPLARYAGAWLDAHAPGRVQRTVLVQGDTGPGNFVADDGRITGIVDWEFAHLGDPMDDLAWLEMRTADGSYGELRPYLERWATATGLSVDDDGLAYYRVAVQYRCAVTTSLAVQRGGGARGWAPYLLVTQRYLLGTVAALERATGWAEAAPPIPERDPTERTPWFEHTIAGVRAAVRGIPDVELREQTRNLIIPLQYLLAYDRTGPELDELDAEDQRATFGAACSGAELADAMEQAGGAGDERAFRYLARRTRRIAALWDALLNRRR